MVVRINEANTSKLCSRCGSQGLRRNGRSVCKNCGIELNADYNGALNILKRALGYISRAGVALTQPELGRMKVLSLTNPESPGFSRGECQISKRETSKLISQKLKRTKVKVNRKS